jgi:hypothetical protein
MKPKTKTPLCPCIGCGKMPTKAIDGSGMYCETRGCWLQYQPEDVATTTPTSWNSWMKRAAARYAKWEAKQNAPHAR